MIVSVWWPTKLIRYEVSTVKVTQGLLAKGPREQSTLFSDSSYWLVLGTTAVIKSMLNADF